MHNDVLEVKTKPMENKRTITRTDISVTEKIVGK
jgi:hypothetical protein